MMGVHPKSDTSERISKFREIELREGKPMAEILQTLFQVYNRQGVIARRLGVTQGTLSQWILKCGLVQRTVLVPIEQIEKGA